MPLCEDACVIVCLQVIVFSMVRSNVQGDVGFLSEQRRNNVAITRARRLLCVLRVSHPCAFTFPHVCRCTAGVSLRTAKPCRVTGVAARVAFFNTGPSRFCQVHARACTAYERQWRSS